MRITDMRKTTVTLITMIGFMAVTSCSEYESPLPKYDENIISLRAEVPNVSRGASTTTASINEFVVYAFTDGAALMDSVSVVRDGGVWTYSPPAYWPVSAVNFYAYSPHISTAADISGQSGANINGYVNHSNVDFLYSVRKNVMQQAAPVSLNFRHALSKVSIMMSSTNPHINVVVSYIVLKNIYKQGDFTFPQSSTLPSTPEVVGTWSDLKTKSDMITFAIIGDEDRVELTPVPTDYTLTTLDQSYVIPQPLSKVELSNEGYAGTYIEVDCEIFDSSTGAKLWPNSSTPSYMLVQGTKTGRIVYPAAADNVKEYKAGHAYVYNISINNPSVLDQIEFDVTVGDYTIEQM